jgi:hypothetical protein
LIISSGFKLLSPLPRETSQGRPSGNLMGRIVLCFEKFTHKGIAIFVELVSNIDKHLSRANWHVKNPLFVSTWRELAKNYT